MFFIKSKWLLLFKLSMMGWITVLSGCSGDKKYELQDTKVLPGVKGELAVSKDNLGNTTLNIRMEFPGSGKADQAPHYIAWVNSDQNTVKLGELNVVDQIGKLLATTDMKEFIVLITSEESPDTTKPVNVPILRSQSIKVE
jgi:hypothetical protein